MCESEFLRRSYLKAIHHRLCQMTNAELENIETIPSLFLKINWKLISNHRELWDSMLQYYEGKIISTPINSKPITQQIYPMKYKIIDMIRKYFLIIFSLKPSGINKRASIKVAVPLLHRIFFHGFITQLQKNNVHYEIIFKGQLHSNISESVPLSYEVDKEKNIIVHDVHHPSTVELISKDMARLDTENYKLSKDEKIAFGIIILQEPNKQLEVVLNILASALDNVFH